MNSDFLFHFLLQNFQKKNEEYLWIWIWIWIWIAAAAGSCHGDCVSVAAGCQVGDPEIGKLASLTGL